MFMGMFELRLNKYFKKTVCMTWHLNQLIAIVDLLFLKRA